MSKHRHRQSPTASAVAVATATVLAVLLAVPFALGQTAARYAEPNFDGHLFSREALLLETQEIASAVSALVALAANFPSDPAINHQLRAMALGIALRLDGTHPGALAANASLKKAELPTTLPDYETLGEVAGQLWTTASYLESPEMGEDERVLQFCLVDIARSIDPTNLADSNRYPARLPESVFPGWDTVVGNSSARLRLPRQGGRPSGCARPKSRSRWCDRPARRGWRSAADHPRQRDPHRGWQLPLAHRLWQHARNHQDRR